MECVSGLYKTECITTTIFHDGPYKTIADIEYATAGWVEWHNNRRLHSSLGHDHPGRVRDRLLRHPQPRTGARMGTARRPGRFTVVAKGEGDRLVSNTDETTRAKNKCVQLTFVPGPYADGMQ